MGGCCILYISYVKRISKSTKWINSLWNSEAIWRRGPCSTVFQIMACCLTAPSHYLNPWWLITTGVLCHPLKSNSTENALQSVSLTCPNTVTIMMTNVVVINSCLCLKSLLIVAHRAKDTAPRRPPYHCKQRDLKTVDCENVPNMIPSVNRSLEILC